MGNLLILNSLELTNFKSFLGVHTFELGREAGLYYVSGKNKIAPELGANGVGKTTLWDALTWVLWGKTGRDARPANAVVPWGLTKGTCSVSLSFTRLRRTYTLIRTRRPNSLVLERKNESRTIEQHEVGALIGMGEEMFRRSVVLGQFGSLFLDLRPEQQSQMFNEALDLDLWLRASAEASTKRKEITGQLEALTTSIAELQGRKAELKEALTIQKGRASEWDTNLAGRLKALKERVASKKAELAILLRGGAPNFKGQGGQSAKGGGLGAREEALARQNRLETRLRRELAEALGRDRGLAQSEGGLLARQAEYAAAIAKGLLCPECGQKAPLTHLKGKLDQTKADLIAAREARKALAIPDLQKELDRVIEETSKEAGVLYEAKVLDREAEVAQQEHDRVYAEDNPHSAGIETITKRIKTTTKTIAEAEGVVEASEADVKRMEYWADAFKEIRLGLIDQVLSELEMTSTRHMESLGLSDWRIEFQTERVTQSGNVSAVFTILLYPPDQEAVKWESYSGGESQRIQLAVSFALSEIILARTGVSPNIEVLDEPTRGLSPEGVQDLLEHLAQRAEELGRAIFVTEHHSLERGLFKNTIVIEKGAKGSVIQ